MSTSLSQRKIIQCTHIAFGSLNSCKWWERCDQVMCFHGYSPGQFYFVWEEETNPFYYVESKSFLNLVFTTWIICFKQSFQHVVPQGAGAQEVQCVPLQAGVMKPYMSQQAATWSSGQSQYQESERTIINTEEKSFL